MIGEAGMHFQIKSILEARAQLSQDDFPFFFFPQRKGKKKERGCSPPCPCKVSIESCLLKPQLMGERGAECGDSAAAAAQQMALKSLIFLLAVLTLVLSLSAEVGFSSSPFSNRY